MKKKEMRLYIAQIVESGKGLGIASLMPEGKPREEAERVLNLSIDSLASQLEMLCEDASFKVEELENAEA